MTAAADTARPSRFRAENLRDIIEGRLRLSFAHFEPGNGFSEGVSCRLSRAGPEQTVTGTKAWLAEADSADAFLVSARDDGGRPLCRSNAGRYGRGSDQG